MRAPCPLSSVFFSVFGQFYRRLRGAVRPRFRRRSLQIREGVPTLSSVGRDFAAGACTEALHATHKRAGSIAHRAQHSEPYARLCESRPCKQRSHSRGTKSHISLSAASQRGA